MDKQTIVQRATVDYKSGFFSWHDLKRKYHELSTEEIFQIIARCNRSTNEKKQ